MKNMTLRQIAKACNGQLFGYDYGTREIAGVVLDSRLIEKDFLFIATVGERVDGHQFINDVFKQGAIAVVCEKEPTSPKGPYILVNNSFLALKQIAKWYRMQLDINIIGITGSVGKTSTKEIISSVLEVKFNVLKTEGNFNNEVGLPLTILKIREEHEIAVLEMGISDFGEMHRLSEIAKPDIAVITNIGPCHLENLGSLEGVLKAKSEIFNFLQPNGYVCINGDDPLLTSIKEVNGRKPITFGISEKNDVYATNYNSNGLLGSSCRIHVSNKTFSTYIPMPGEHMVRNALAAASIGTLLHMTPDEIAKGIHSIKPVSGRNNIIRTNQWTIIDDCYNANPISMKTAIDLLNQADTRKVAILGDMFELGETEKELHKEIGVYVASSNVDLLLCVGTRSKDMYEGAKEANFIGGLEHFETLNECRSQLSSLLQNDDTILVKASHGMNFQAIIKTLLN